MDVFEAIKGRRTIRSFKRDRIPQEVLDQVFEAAMWAPSHGNVQPWEFVLVGPEAREKLLKILQAKVDEMLQQPDLPEGKKMGLMSLRDDFGGAPHMVAVLSRKPVEPLETLEHPASTATAVQNMVLTAWSHGVGSVWLSVGAAPPSRAILGVPEGAQVVALLALGYPWAVPPAPPRDEAKARIREVP
jgi:nitroreductase